MSVFVLVHGAFHGGWCWERVSARLRGRGHEVYAPTLTGLGEREGEGGGEVGLSTHIEDVVSLLSGEDLRGVTLVGHSYSGMVIAGAADRARERIGHVVFLDAFVPEDGESLGDIKGRAWVEWVEARGGEGQRLAAPSSRQFDVTDEADIAWADSLLTPQPVKTFTEAVRIGNKAGWLPKCSYIACTEQEDSFVALAARLKRQGWPVYEIETGHDAMITAPGALCDLLCRISGAAK